MKLVTSTGDLSLYASSMTACIKHFEKTKFRYLNLEQSESIAEFYTEDDNGWRRLADEWGNAAAQAGVSFAVSHAPCLHTPCLNVFSNPNDETYRTNIRAIRRSIEICHLLGIARIVVHACPHDSFTEEDFYRYNTKFYREFFDLMEKYNITVMTENWDNANTKFTTGAEIRRFLDYVDHPLLAACWDTAHSNIVTRRPLEGQYQHIVDLGDKLKGLHISDNFGDAHHHSWPFAGIINFDAIMQGLLDVNYDGFFTFEASYTLLHSQNIPYHRKPWQHGDNTVTTLLDPPLHLKQKAVDLLYDIGKYILETYNCFEE